MTEQEHKNLERRVKDNKYLTRYETDYIVDALEEVQQYRIIGTPDECMAAVEKQKAKKVKDVSMVRDNEVYIGRIGKCHCCDDIVEEDTLYCENCGQKLDWSDEE